MLLKKNTDRDTAIKGMPIRCFSQIEPKLLIYIINLLTGFCETFNAEHRRFKLKFFLYCL